MAFEANSPPLSLTIILGRPRSATEAIQLPRDTQAGQRGVRHKGEAFPGAVIHDGEYAEAATRIVLHRNARFG